MISVFERNENIVGKGENTDGLSDKKLREKKKKKSSLSLSHTHTHTHTHTHVLFSSLFQSFSLPNSGKIFCNDVLNSGQRLKFFKISDAIRLHMMENIVKEKEIMLVTTTFSFSHNVFKRKSSTLGSKNKPFFHKYSALTL